MTDIPERNGNGSGEPGHGHRPDYLPLPRPWPPHRAHIPGPTDFGAPIPVHSSAATSAAVAEALIAANRSQPDKESEPELPVAFQNEPEPEAEPVGEGAADSEPETFQQTERTEDVTAERGSVETPLERRSGEDLKVVVVPINTTEAVAQSEPDAEQPADRPRMTDAIRNHPVALLFPVVVLVAAAIVVGLLRSPQHKAEARLLVGTLDIKAQAVPGYVIATEQLADSYSRLGPTDVVLKPAAEKLGVTPSALSHDVTITSLPQNPIVRVIAQSPSARTAAAEANAVADSLRTYVASLGNTYSSAATIVSDYGSAAHDYEILAVRRDGLRDTLTQLRVPASDLSKRLSPAERRAQVKQTSAKLASVSEQADAAQLLMNGNAAAYNQRLQDQRQPQTLSSLGHAVSNGTDRSVFLEQAGAIAVILGFLIGLPYALRRERQMCSADHVDTD